MSTEYACGNVFVRQMLFDGYPGGVVDGHAHNFDHVTYVVRGSVRIEKLDDQDNVVRVVEKSASQGFNWILIEAGTKHRLTALEPGSIGHCIYAHRDPQGQIVLSYDGWTPAYL